jgi:hypothetical protein
MKKPKNPLSFLVGMLLCLLSVPTHAAEKAQRTPPAYIQHTSTPNAFALSSNHQSAAIVVDPQDWKGVLRAANDLGNDVGKVTGTASVVTPSRTLKGKGCIIVGTIGKSKLIDGLIAKKKINVSDIKGQWESFVIQTVDGNLIIAGSDKRGTIYGIYDVSEKIGVDPWYWWADVPVKKSDALFVQAGRYVQDSPKVKYRGIFINDESPSMATWCQQFGGFNSKMYTHMFELLLRLKANYLWPAMWGKTFNEEDPLNPLLADEYGIIMGTSHHEPMMRAQQEYTNRKNEVGPWDYTTNKDRLLQFWFDGVNRNKNYDNIITIGMRGDGDVAMGKGDDKENIQTLQNVVAGQREQLRKAYGKDPAQIPQLWAIFTEVQRYYDAGLTVPDDVLLLFCDNNWGYVRRIAPPKEKDRKGGCGLYYHIDMNGGPWNDRWVNTTTIPKLREQFHLAYEGGLDDLWVVNVGDLKPKELPIDFILHYAWNPDAYPADKTMDYTVEWATRTFGPTYAADIADIVSTYTKYNLLRKAEAQTTRIFSYVNYHEADRVLNKWKAVVAKAESIGQKIAPEYKDAYYQLVLYPTKASAGVFEIYMAAGKNNLYAQQGRVSANDFAQRARDLFEQDKQLSDYYNGAMSNGKWKGMMSDVHLGYRTWSMPRANTLPNLTEVTPLTVPTMGIAVEGSEASWPGATTAAALPAFDGLNPTVSYGIDVFNKGTGSFHFKAVSDQPWIRLSAAEGDVTAESRLSVSVDWNALGEGTSTGTVTLQQGSTAIPVTVKAVKATLPTPTQPYFGSLTGEFSIPAHQFNANVAGKDASWIVLPDLGRDEACMGISPVTASPAATPENAARLEYQVYLPQAGNTTFVLGLLPTQDIHPERGLRIAVSIDNQAPVFLDARKGLVDTFSEYTPKNLAQSNVLKALPPVNRELALKAANQQRRDEVFDNLRWLDVSLNVEKAGMHTFKVFMVDPELVLERIVVNPDNEHPSYFGAPSLRHTMK